MVVNNYSPQEPFSGALSFDGVPPYAESALSDSRSFDGSNLGTWNVSSVLNMEAMFQ
jgi:hypothetical protein